MTTDRTPLTRRALRPLRPILTGIALAAGLAACGSGDDEIAYVERPPEQIYGEAVQELEERNFIEAAQLFDEVERQHPYSRLATTAQTMAAFAYYEALRYDEAIVTLDRFIQIHPGHEDIAYAYYLRAISYYEQISDVRRDQRMTELALQSLEEVVRRFPETEYARDSSLKLDLTRDHLAGKEMEIGRYYLNQGNMHAAIRRFRTVIEQYQTTSHVAEALHRVTEAYLQLGVIPEARDAAAVLGHNFPGSPWYEDSYALLAEEGYEPSARAQKGWLARAWDSLF